MVSKLRELLKDEYIKRWLSNRNPRTVNNYLSAFKAYMEYTGLTPEEMIKEASDELLKPPHREDKRCGAAC